MSKEVGRGCHVTVELVIANVTTKERMEEAIEQIADVIDENPWLGLGDALEQLIQAYEELDYVPDR